VHSISGEALLTLTRPDGQSIRFDAALVTEPQAHKARIRAWKFGQAIFDLTMDGRDVYLVSPEKSSRAEDIRKAGVSAAQLTRAWSVLSGGFFDADDLKIEEHDKVLRASRLVDSVEVVCEIERATLVPRKYMIMDDLGRQRFTLTLDRYQIISAIPWAKRMTATSDSGVIKVEFRDVELNGEIPPGAFTPPKRAEKLP
jgi:hypothetical protein